MDMLPIKELTTVFSTGPIDVLLINKNRRIGP